MEYEDKKLFNLLVTRTKPVGIEEKVTFVKAILPGLSEITDEMRLNISLHVASVNAGLPRECLEEELAKFLKANKVKIKGD